MICRANHSFTPQTILGCEQLCTEILRGDCREIRIRGMHGSDECHSGACEVTGILRGDDRNTKIMRMHGSDKCRSSARKVIFVCSNTSMGILSYIPVLSSESPVVAEVHRIFNSHVHLAAWKRTLRESWTSELQGFRMRDTCVSVYTFSQEVRTRGWSCLQRLGINVPPSGGTVIRAYPSSEDEGRRRLSCGGDACVPDLCPSRVPLGRGSDEDQEASMDVPEDKEIEISVEREPSSLYRSLGEVKPEARHEADQNLRTFKRKALEMRLGFYEDVGDPNLIYPAHS